jgi:hypothetical protein
LISEFKELWEEGKVKYIGLPEASMDNHHSWVHPFTSVQKVVSMDIDEEAIVPETKLVGSK